MATVAASHREVQAQAQDIEVLKAELASLKAKLASQEPIEQRIERERAERAREEVEREIRWKEAQDQVRQKAAADALERERILVETRPQVPSPEQMMAFRKGVNRFLIASHGRSNTVAGQERETWAVFEPLIDTCLMINREPSPLAGWPRYVRESLSGLANAILEAGRGWGWHKLIVSPEERQAVLNERWLAWERNRLFQRYQAADLWIRIYEQGCADPPEKWIRRIGLEAREKGIPLIEEINPRFLGAVPDSRGWFQPQKRIEDTWDYQEEWWRRSPALGSNTSSGYLEASARSEIIQWERRLSRGLSLEESE